MFNSGIGWVHHTLTIFLWVKVGSVGCHILILRTLSSSHTTAIWPHEFLAITCELHTEGLDLNYCWKCGEDWKCWTKQLVENKHTSQRIRRTVSYSNFRLDNFLYWIIYTLRAFMSSQVMIYEGHYLSSLNGFHN